MIVHYLKVAFRTLLKYKVQSFISILGLSIAFACVTLAVYWSHYEETYDAFHQNADRIYVFSTANDYNSGYINKNGDPRRIPAYLENIYPEVEKACGVFSIPPLMFVTPGATSMFDFECIEGNADMASWNDHQVGITEDFAREQFGNSSPIGQKIENYDLGEVEIVAMYKTWSKHSNFKFNLLGKLEVGHKWPRFTPQRFYVMLKPECKHKRFIEKVQNDTIKGVTEYPFTIKEFMSLQSLHYMAPKYNKNLKQPNVQIEYVHLFAWAAFILSLCALLNYLTLFISRLATKGRDLALRTVYGSSGWQLSILLMVEYLLLLLVAFVVSGVFIELTMNKFIEYSMIEVNRSTIYTGCVYLLFFVILLAMLLSLVPILFFKRKTLHMQIEPASVIDRRNPFRKASLCIQLFTSLLFMFCTTIMIKQVYFLTHADIGIERKNIAYILMHHNLTKTVTEQTLKQLPCVKDMQIVAERLYPYDANGSYPVEKWDEKPDETPSFKTDFIGINDKVADFFGIRIKEGVHSFDALNDNGILVNETFVKAMNVDNPIGKTIYFNASLSKIVGVVYDFYAQRPTDPINPIIFSKMDEKRAIQMAVKYDGDFNSFKNKLEEIHKQKELDRAVIFDAEELYQRYMVSEYNFLKLLSIVALATLLIALFGVYALILQECERQRKNIAIRKVYGAHVKDILMMFFKEYMLQVMIAAFLAFPIGYALMKPWLEGYSRQTTIGIEVFLGIFLGMAFLVMLCIGWHVWCAANENPATAVKK